MISDAGKCVDGERGTHLEESFSFNSDCWLNCVHVGKVTLDLYVDLLRRENCVNLCLKVPLLLSKCADSLLTCLDSCESSSRLTINLCTFYLLVVWLGFEIPRVLGKSDSKHPVFLTIFTSRDLIRFQ